MTSLVELPSATSTLASVGAYSSPVFSELLPIGLLAAGLIIGGLIVAFVISAIIEAVARLVHRDPRP